MKNTTTTTSIGIANIHTIVIITPSIENTTPNINKIILKISLHILKTTANISKTIKAYNNIFPPNNSTWRLSLQEFTKLFWGSTCKPLTIIHFLYKNFKLFKIFY